MLKRKAFRQGTLLIASLFAVAVLFAGCGGSGGGGSVGSGYGSLNAIAVFPKNPESNRVAYSTDTTYTATVGVLSYPSSASVAPTTKASTSVNLTYNASTYTYSGTFTVSKIPVGNNYIAKITKYYTCPDTGETHADGHIGALVETISSDTTTSLTVNATSTVVALAALRYALTYSSSAARSASAVAMSDTTVITSSIIGDIEDAVTALWASNASSYMSYIFHSYNETTGDYNDPFDTSTWSTNTSLTALLDGIIAEALKAKVVKFYINSTEISKTATTATGVNPEAPVFKVVFTKAMKTTVNLNSASTLSASGMGIALERDDTGGTLTINCLSATRCSALNYGTFAWATTTVAGDTLTYTLKSTAILTANDLKYLVPGKTYNITSWVPPSNLLSAGGKAVSTTGVSTTGSFTTATDTTAPSVSSFHVSGTEISKTATSTTGVPYDGPYFKVILNEEMDGTIDLNNPATLIASSFGIDLERDDTGGTLTINCLSTTDCNALDYGSFSWVTITYNNDALMYTLKSNTILEANQLKTLQSGTTYNITSWTVPSNLKDISGNAVSTSGISTTGSFTTE